MRGSAPGTSVESFRPLFKRGLYETHHCMSARQLHRYVTEFAGRRKARDCDSAEQMRRMARGLFAKIHTYRQLTGKAAAA